MKMFDVQAIEIMSSPDEVFTFVKEAANLPRWAHAFASARDGHAVLQTPNGAVDIALDVMAERSTGTVDWRLTFPDGGVALAHSRATGTTRGTCIYSFVLHAPPVALEQIEGALEAQIATLQTELVTLKSLVEKR